MIERGDASVLSFASSPGKRLQKLLLGPYSISIVFILLGIICSGIFLALGVRWTQDRKNDFNMKLQAVGQRLELALADYEMAALWVHQASHQGRAERSTFQQVYAHLETILDFQYVGFLPRVATRQRGPMEQEALNYYNAFYPSVNYTGFVGFETCTDESLCIAQRSNQTKYYPMHYVEPIIRNKNMPGFDFMSEPSQKETIQTAIATEKPILTGCLAFLETISGLEENDHLVQLMHPGIVLDAQRPTREISVISFSLSSLLQRILSTETSHMALQVEDITENAEFRFLGAMERITEDGEDLYVILGESEFSSIEWDRRGAFDVQFASRRWRVTEYTLEEPRSNGPMFLSLGGVCALIACMSLALYVHLSNSRILAISRARRDADQSYARHKIRSARQKAKAERELNDFIAHEVRNPVAGAIAACSFVQSALEHADCIKRTELLQSIRDDVRIIDQNLSFVNDLLRDMLDMHRAKSNQLPIELSRGDILKDIFEPVGSMLYGRGHAFKVEIVCPPQLIIMTDKLRLKQIFLNLGRNATKFVERGFIRFRAEIVNGRTRLSIEDSGPGIPESKHDLIFQKYQESLDLLSQGTGIGLCLCKNLADLLGATLWLDREYTSGIGNYLGTRFVLDLNVLPQTVDADEELDEEDIEANDLVAPAVSEGDSTPATDHESFSSKESIELPENLKVLFVDDDTILRKLFSRSLQRVAPAWIIEEAANGETALQMTDKEEFDLIFMDQYMASVQKQLLGTETVIALRSKGVESIICGLSANDVAEAFKHAGADAFMMKPFPTNKDALKKQLFLITSGDQSLSLRTSSHK